MRGKNAIAYKIFACFCISVLLLGYWSVTANAKAKQPPAAPTGLAVSAVTQTSATLTWTATTGATSYKVYKNGSSTSYLTLTTNTAPITGLTASTTYSFKVSAVNAGGEGAQSTAVTVTTLPAVPAAPIGLAVSAATQTSATLTWTAATGATSYKVYENGSSTSCLTPTTNTAPITGLTASTTYSFKVSAVNAGGEGAQSTAVTVTTLPVVPAGPTLNVLEVQPGTTYDLTQSLLSGTFPNNTINITQMSMPEFISKVDEINGKYDIVYIGNNTDGGLYTALGQGPSSLNLPEGGTNGQTSQEYYSDNDITNRRATTLKSFIDSKQLTIFDQNIFESSLNKTKLYANFNSYKNNTSNPNFLTINTSINKSFNLTTALSAYNGNSVARRPVLTLNSQPVQYDGTDASYQTNTSLGYNFSINNQTTANNMTVKLYLDLNGDGIYKSANDYADPSELESETDNLNSGTGYTLNYRLPDSFVGLMPWKLELTDSTGAKSYVTGATAFKASSPAGELQIHVLQLEPSTTISSNAQDNHLSIYSLSNVNGQNLLHKADVYNIQVTEMYIKDFNAAYANLTGTQTPQPASAIVNGQTTTAPTALNGNYDMVIMGFADVYGGQTYSDLTNTNSIKALQSFINTNQSVLLTHDTLSFSPDYLPGSYDPNNPSNVNAKGYGYNITKYFRDVVGQQRYFQSPTTYQDPMPNSSKPSFGWSNYALARNNSGVNNDNQTFQTTTQVHKLNDNLVTQFPFVLGDIPVSPTHFQYYQLNLEDERVVPVYTLTNDSGSTIYNQPGDGRNDYYTYTKGNITYSGTGHSLVNGLPEEEMFVNTMIKASRGANHAPTLDVSGISNGMTIANTLPSINFGFTATDMDPNDQYLNANINLSTSTDGTTFSPYQTVQQFSSQDPDLTKRVKSAVPQAVSLNTVNNANPPITAYKVQVVVTDNEGAQVSSKEIMINSVNDPQVTPQSPNNLACLVGDTLPIPVTVSATQTGLIETFKNINLQGIKTNPSGVTTTVISSRANDYPDITFTPAPSWSAKSNNYSVTFNDVGTNKIQSKLNYTAYTGTSQTGIARENDQTFSVQVGSGKIDVQVLDSGNKGLTGIPVVISGPFQNGTTNTTGASGSASFTGLGSGNYTVTLNVPNGYTFSGSTSQTVSLSASSPAQNIMFTLNQLISTINPTTATFDKNTANTTTGHYADIPVTMTLNGSSLTSITNGSTTLNPGSDYTVSGSNVTLSKTYLSTLPTSENPTNPTNLTFTFSSGNTQVLAITVIDSTPTKLISNLSITTQAGAHHIYILPNVPIQAIIGLDLSRKATYLTMDFSKSNVNVTLSNLYCYCGHTRISFSIDPNDPKKLIPSDSTTFFPGGTYTFNALITEANTNLIIESTATAQDAAAPTFIDATDAESSSSLGINIGTAPLLH